MRKDFKFHVTYIILFFYLTSNASSSMTSSSELEVQVPFELGFVSLFNALATNVMCSLAISISRVVTSSFRLATDWHKTQKCKNSEHWNFRFAADRTSKNQKLTRTDHTGKSGLQTSQSLATGLYDQFVFNAVHVRVLLNILLELLPYLHECLINLTIFL